MKPEIREYKAEDAKPHYDAVKASIEDLNTWFSFPKPNYCLCDSIKFIQDQPNLKKEDKHDFAIIDTPRWRIFRKLQVKHMCKRQINSNSKLLAQVRYTKKGHYGTSY